MNESEKWTLDLFLGMDVNGHLLKGRIIELIKGNKHFSYGVIMNLALTRLVENGYLESYNCGYRLTQKGYNQLHGIENQV